MNKVALLVALVLYVFCSSGTSQASSNRQPAVESIEGFHRKLEVELESALGEPKLIPIKVKKILIFIAQHHLDETVGDSIAQAQLVRNQMLEVLELSLISPYSNEEEQTRALYANAFSFAKSSGRGFGDVLNLPPSQVAHDMIWPEKRLIKGRLQLFPRLYLSERTISKYTSDEQASLESIEVSIENQILSLEKQEANLKEKIGSMQQQNQNLAARQSSLTSELNTNLEEIASLKSQLSQYESQSADLQRKIDEISASNHKGQSALQTIKHKENQLQSQSSHLTSEALSLEAEKERLEQRQRDLETQIAEANSRVATAQEGLKESALIAQDLSKLEDYVKQIERRDTSSSLIKENVGYLISPSTDCTAYRIAPQVIRTAAHCVDSPNKIEEKVDYKFYNLAGKHSKATIVTRLVRSQDLIEMRLERPVSNAPILETADIEPAKSLDFIFYDTRSGFTPTYRCDVFQYNQNSGYFLHNCPSMKGASGGVFFQLNKVVGFHIGKLVPGDGLGVAHHIPENANFADILADAELEWNCDSNCVKTTSFHTPCPTWKKPGRMCRQEQKFSDPVCEAAKAADCAARETQRMIEAAIDGLKKNINDLANRRNQLKFSVAGLDKTFTDLNDTFLGRNESIKTIIGEIDKAAVQIDGLRADITRQILFVDKQKELLKEALRVAQVSEADIKNVTNSVEKLESVNLKKVTENEVTRTANEVLKTSTEQLHAAYVQVSDQAADLEKKSKDLVTRNTETVADIIDSAGDLGSDINRELVNLKNDISVENLSKALQPVEELFNKVVVENLAKAAEWYLERFAESGPKGPRVADAVEQMRQFARVSLWGKALIVSNNSGWLEHQFNKALKALHGDFVPRDGEVDQNMVCSSNTGAGVCIDPQVVGGVFADAGMVCEKDLYDAVRTGEPGVHWVQVEPGEYCRLRWQHVGNYWRNGFRRNMERSWCETYWGTQRFNKAANNKPQTFRCKDIRPQLKAYRDQVDEENAKIRRELEPELAPVFETIKDLLGDYKDPQDRQNEESLKKDIENEKQKQKDLQAKLNKAPVNKNLSIVLAKESQISAADLEQSLENFLNSYNDLGQVTGCDKEKMLRVIGHYSNSKYMISLLANVSTALEAESDKLAVLREKVLSWGARAEAVRSRYKAHCVATSSDAKELLDQGRLGQFDLLALKENVSPELLERRENSSSSYGAVKERVKRLLNKLGSFSTQFSEHDFAIARYAIFQVADPYNYRFVSESPPFIHISEPTNLEEAERVSQLLDRMEEVLLPYIPAEGM